MRYYLFFTLLFMTVHSFTNAQKKTISYQCAGDKLLVYDPTTKKILSAKPDKGAYRVTMNEDDPAIELWSGKLRLGKFIVSIIDAEGVLAGEYTSLGGVTMPALMTIDEARRIITIDYTNVNQRHTFIIIRKEIGK
jgi:hypothetical protein